MFASGRLIGEEIEQTGIGCQPLRLLGADIGLRY
jgi:hypothetical protein